MWRISRVLAVPVESLSLSLWPQAPSWSFWAPVVTLEPTLGLVWLPCHTTLSLSVCRRGGPRAPGSRLGVSLHPSPCCPLLLRAWTPARRAPSPGFISRTPVNEKGFPSCASAACIESDFVLNPEVEFLAQVSILWQCYLNTSSGWGACRERQALGVRFTSSVCTLTRIPVPVCLSRCSFFWVFVPLEECPENMNRHQVYFWIRRRSPFQKLRAHKLSHVSPVPWAHSVREDKRSPQLLTSKPGWFSG